MYTVQQLNTIASMLSDYPNWVVKPNIGRGMLMVVFNDPDTYVLFDRNGMVVQIMLNYDNDNILCDIDDIYNYLKEIL